MKVRNNPTNGFRAFENYNFEEISNKESLFLEDGVGTPFLFA